MMSKNLDFLIMTSESSQKQLQYNILHGFWGKWHMNVKVETSNTTFRKESTLDPEKLIIQYKYIKTTFF